MKPWGGMDPNSRHQLWSEWCFDVFDGGRRLSIEDVRGNAARWLAKAFGSVGRAKVQRQLRGWRILAQVEGVDAHDPQVVEFVRRQFQEHFVSKGWGPLASSTVRARVLAGDRQDGRPSAQLVVMETIRPV